VNRLLYFSFFFIILSWSCTGPEESPKALVNIFLIDSPAQWDSVVVELEGVELDFVPDGRDGTIEKIFFPYELADKQIDLAQLVGGATLPVGRKEMQLGVITGATLRLGPNNKLYQGDKGYSLPLPGGETDFFAEVSVDLSTGISYDLIVDFDLEKSIQQIDENPITFDFNPSIRITSDIGNGDIQGTISPTTLSPAIYAVQGTDSISTHVNSSGTFLFRLPAGIYTLYFDPKNSAYFPDTILNVEVIEKERLILDRITFIKK